MAKKSPLTWSNQTRKLSDLIPWPDNPRFIADEQAQRLDDSFRKFGQVDPLAISPENELYNGHQRLKVLVDSHGPDYEIDVRVSSRPLTEAERKQLTVYLHRGATGEWDFEKLATWDLGDLLEWGFEADDLNFETPAPAGTGDAEPQTDRAAELQEKWQTERGQLWAIGEHRLLCGDSTVRADVERVMGGERADMVFTDPPFAIFGASTGVSGDIADDNMIRPFFREWISGLYPHVKQWGHWYVCCDWRTYALIWQIGHDIKLKAKTAIVWDKGEGGLGAYYQSQHELIIMFSSDPGQVVGTSRRTGARTVNGTGNIWRLGRLTEPLTEGHRAMKPPKMYEIGIGNSSEEGDVVIDPFCGGGTLLVACQNLNRRGRAIEISPAYCAVILQRMADAFPHLEIHQLP